jgi:hypothetical protein
MGYRERLITTAIIWVALLVFLGNIFTSPTSSIGSQSGVAFGITFVMAIAATLSTIVIWVAGGGHEENRREETRTGKSKRQDPNRVRRLMDDLSDDEIYELESMLLGQQQEQNNPRRRQM